ncbi:MAG: hypothetical protein C4532_04680 [Candidatus Abyssobacteria bacterium SURF_17]|uniref:Uncharacterized protein n=1 Tax=Candidatus Abyssobacteria bacterium SURF_17 TaxID=2093361 RepID=A0A419F483_9BACT|nr:MAG: hypothetical protein C4532_04680 [Candidatus Abyssubacteria bacterium SURF_17]
MSKIIQADFMNALKSLCLSRYPARADLFLAGSVKETNSRHFHLRRTRRARAMAVFTWKTSFPSFILSLRPSRLCGEKRCLGQQRIHPTIL